MKIVELAIIVIIFSGTVTLFDTLGIFNYSMAPVDVGPTEDQATGIYQIGNAGGIDSKQSWYEQVENGIEFVFKLMTFAASALSMGLNIGSIFEKYIPGVVGSSLSTLITGISWFFYAWGGFQIWRRFSTKGAD